MHPSKRRPDSTRRLVFRVAQLCSAVRDILSARRVSVLLYDPSSRTVSPLTSDRPDDERLRELARRWSRIPLDDFPAARSVLLDQQPVDIEDAQRDVRLPPGMAADFGVTSVHLEPLVDNRAGRHARDRAGRAPRQSPDLESIVPLVAASVGRVRARRSTEGDRPETESRFLVELMEAAAERALARRRARRLCERLARRLGARSGSGLPARGRPLVPRMARATPTARCDPDAWERFRGAATPLPLVDAALEAGDAVIAEEPDRR